MQEPALGGRALGVLDIDGVVADVRHRLHHLAAHPKDWAAFFAQASDDPLLPEGAAVARHLATDHEVVWLSGRPEPCRAETLRWLRSHDLPAGRLRLRAVGDRRPARVVKLEQLRSLARERRVAVLVDDDPAVVAAAEQAGFAVLRADWMSRPDALLDALHEAQQDDGRT